MELIETWMRNLSRQTVWNAINVQQSNTLAGSYLQKLVDCQ